MTRIVTGHLAIRPRLGYLSRSKFANDDDDDDKGDFDGASAIRFKIKGLN